MTSSNDVTLDHRPGPSRAELARQMLRVRAARHEADEAERAEAAADPAAARAELTARLDALVDQRRQALAAEMEMVRAEAATMVAEARARGEALVERAEIELNEVEVAHREAMSRAAAAREAAARAAAEREAAARAAAEREAAEREAAEREAAARAAAEREAAERAAAERAAAEHAERVAALAALQLDDEPPAASTDIPVVPLVTGAASAVAADDAIWASTLANNPAATTPPPTTPPPTTPPPTTPPPHAAPPPSAVPATPSVVLDAQAFAQAFGTVIASLLRDYNPRYHEPPAPTPKPSFWSSAKHLDVMLIGVTMVIALVVLAAWLV